MGIKALVIDLDGTVYHGKTLIEHADEALKHLSKRYELYYLTNNSTRSRAEFAQKLETFGISCTKQQLITSGFAAAEYIHEQYPRSRVYVIGEDGLKQELVEHEITLCEDDCDCVLVGLDTGFTYAKLKKALTLLLNGAVFIATNTDPFLITNERIIPGAGSIVAAVATGSGKKPLVIGKPSAFITDLIVKQAQVQPQETLVVGDNLQTDILMGVTGGMQTAFVLTGASKRDDIERLHIRPDYVFESIVDLPEGLAHTPQSNSGKH
jgi:4-nitrophenyl phosphatase